MNEEKKLIRSYGRIKSRKLSQHKKDLLSNDVLAYEIDDNILWQAQDSEWRAQHKITKNILEIGFGFGDFTYAKAKANPQSLIFGCEPHINGVVNLLNKLEQEPLSNIRISRQDVRILLEKFPQNFFDEVYILFPDPWPKSKHFKRRLINVEFLDEVLCDKMKSNGKLTIATDHDSYKTWILSHILRSKKFTWTAESKKDWQNFPDDWIVTKYQRKALEEGRTPVIFQLTCHL